jgi:hypothetical protein
LSHAYSSFSFSYFFSRVLSLWLAWTTILLSKLPV